VPDCELSIVAASHTKIQVQVKEANNWQWIAVAGAIVLAVGAGAFWLFSHRSPVLSEKDAVVLADFANSTGDPVFDGTLRQVDNCFTRTSRGKIGFEHYHRSPGTQVFSANSGSMQGSGGPRRKAEPIGSFPFMTSMVRNFWQGKAPADLG